MASACTTETFNSSEESSYETIQKLKDVYGQQCRVITDVGEYAYVINVKLYDALLSIKFQLAGDFGVQNVIVQCKYLIQEQLEELSTVLRNSNPYTSLVGKVEQCKLLIEAKGLDLESAVTTPKPKRKQKSKKKRPKSQEEEAVCGKLPSMKTATDVLSRIFWDDELDVEDFAVGYLDRFLGIVEKPVTAFSWEDIASVDYNTLAIPKHRICYYKYKGWTVWDKEKRLDEVFGSSGSTRTIYDVMKMMKEQSHLFQTEPVCRTVDNDDSDDDDDVEIVCSQPEPEENPMAPDGTRKLTNREMYWGPKTRPTHFIALRIQSPRLISAVGEAHDLIREINPAYAESLIPLDKLHVTLSCLGLDDEESVRKAAATLHRIRHKIEDFEPQNIQLSFKGVDHFFNTTLYAQVHDQIPDGKSANGTKITTIHDFVTSLQALLQEEGIAIRNVFDFVPHMTLMKLSRQFQSETYTHYMDMRVCDVLKDKSFGVQNISNMHLCVMSQEKQEDGFYVTPTFMNFD